MACKCMGLYCLPINAQLRTCCSNISLGESASSCSPHLGVQSRSIGNHKTKHGASSSIFCIHLVWQFSSSQGAHELRG